MMRWMRAMAALAACACLVAPLAARAEDDGKDRKDKARTYALLIGCTEYPELRKEVSPATYRSKIRLEGCENDVALMQETLVERLGVRAEDIVALAGWPEDPAARPTRANIRAGFGALAKKAYRPGDRVIVHYSGHGVNLPDDNDDELDGLDEAWLPADARKDKAIGYAGVLRDEEIGRHLEAIVARGASVWCIMDCCHSTTGTRGPRDEPVHMRGVDPAVLDLRIEPSSTHGGPSSGTEGRLATGTAERQHLVVFYAAQSNQEVPEVRMPLTGADRKPYGLLTSCLVRALGRSGGQLTFGELYEQVAAGYRGLGKHHIVQPYAEGDLRQRVFDGGRHVGVPLFVRKVGPSSYELSAGAIHGMTVGTQLDAYAPGHAGDPARRYGRVEVKRVGPVTSQVGIIETETKPADDDGVRWPAEIVSFEIDATLPLCLVDASGRPVAEDAVAASVREELDGDLMQARFPRVQEPAKAAWLLALDAAGEPDHLRPRIHGRGAPRYDVRKDVMSLGTALDRIYRGESLLRLAAEDRRVGRLPGGLQLRVSVHGTEKAIRPGQPLVPGTNLDFHLVKGGRRPPDGLDVYVFWMDARYGIDMVYPPRGEGARLSREALQGAGETIPLGEAGAWMVDDLALGPQRMIVFAAPPRDDAPGLELSFLASEPLKVRGTSKPKLDHPTASLLYGLAVGGEKTRGTRVVRRSEAPLAMSVLTFESRWQPVRVPPPVARAPRSRVEATDRAEANDGPPDAWAFSGDIHLAQAGPAKAWCLLCAPGKTVSHVLLDLDEQVMPDSRKPEGLAAMLRKRDFGADMAIRVEHAHHRVTVWYDRDRDGRFDLVLIDRDDDQRADERWRWAGGTWVHDTEVDEALITSRHIDWRRRMDEQIEAIDRIGAVAGR